jgi:hypothetical protein
MGRIEFTKEDKATIKEVCEIFNAQIIIVEDEDGEQYINPPRPRAEVHQAADARGID